MKSKSCNNCKNRIDDECKFQIPKFGVGSVCSLHQYEDDPLNLSIADIINHYQQNPIDYFDDISGKSSITSPALVTLVKIFKSFTQRRKATNAITMNGFIDFALSSEEIREKELIFECGVDSEITDEEVSSRQLIQKIFDVIQNNSYGKFDDVRLEVVAYKEITPLEALASFGHSIKADGSGIDDRVIKVIWNIDVYKENFPITYKNIITHTTQFVESLGIEVDDEVLLLGILLHEFGHADLLRRRVKRVSYLSAFHMSQAIENIIHTVMSSSMNLKSSCEKNTFFYMNMSDELYAENFKFINFVRIWKILHPEFFIK